MGHIQRYHLSEARVGLPSHEVLQTADALITPMFDRVIANNLESKTLAALRNALLPKLMSGEIRISAVQQGTVPTAVEASVHTAPEQFKEAILIAALVRAAATPEFPLGRMRYNKLAYLIHRKAQHDVQHQYLKKAAGPYSPWAKYQGPEKIAIQRRYITHHRSAKFEGLISGPNIEEIDKYLPRYDFAQALGWAVNKFRYRKNDELELLATVDFAAVDLSNRNIQISASTIKNVIAENTEWAPKLNRAVFSDFNISAAINEMRNYFPDTYGA